MRRRSSTIIVTPPTLASEGKTAVSLLNCACQARYYVTLLYHAITPPGSPSAAATKFNVARVVNTTVCVAIIPFLVCQELLGVGCARREKLSLPVLTTGLYESPPNAYISCSLLLTIGFHCGSPPVSAYIYYVVPGTSMCSPHPSLFFPPFFFSKCLRQQNTVH